MFTNVSEILASSINSEMEAASTSEILVNYYQTTQCSNPEHSHLYTRCHKNIKSCCIIAV
jgi:hypothetical protein